LTEPASPAIAAHVLARLQPAVQNAMTAAVPPAAAPPPPLELLPELDVVPELLEPEPEPELEAPPPLELPEPSPAPVDPSSPLLPPLDPEEEAPPEELEPPLPVSPPLELEQPDEAARRTTKEATRGRSRAMLGFSRMCAISTHTRQDPRYLVFSLSSIRRGGMATAQPAYSFAQVVRSARLAVTGALVSASENLARPSEVLGLDLHANAARAPCKVRHDARHLRADDESADALELEPLLCKLGLGCVGERSDGHEIIHVGASYRTPRPFG
jgi:hypothetical protein